MFAKNLKKVMDEKGISAAELSRLTGYSKSAISQYLSGAIRKLPQKKVKVIAEALQCTMEELYGTVPKDPDWIDELAQGIPVLTIQDVAKLLHKSVKVVEQSLQQGTAKFGHATLMPSGKWSYTIYTIKFMELTGIPVADI